MVWDVVVEDLPAFADGRWKARPRMAGTYELAATAKGYVPVSRSSVRVTAAANVEGLDPTH